MTQPAFKGLNGEMASKFGISLDQENVHKLVINNAMQEKENLH